MLDLATTLERFLNTTNAHTVTNIFLLIISAIFIYSTGLAVSGKGRLFTSVTPSLLTSLGILGTFIGIVIGLLGFNPKDIDGSIELLLSGLKTAFITSLAGMSGAIIYKILGSTKLFSDNRGSNIVTEVEPKDILKAIIKQEDHLIGLKKAISGGEETSLIGQIKLLRSDINDGQKNRDKSFEEFTKELWGNLKSFSEMLSKSATDEVVKALKNVITDFNKNLTEQFGDNFKALDESVKKLVDWQTNYSAQLEHMIKQYSEGVKAITDIEASVTSINNETKAIPESMSKLESIIEVNQHQISELSSHLGAFREMREQAVKAIPEMQSHVEKTVQEIAMSAKTAADGYQSLLTNTEGVQKTFSDSIEQVTKRLDSSISELLEKQTSEMNRSFAAMEGQVQSSVDLAGKAVNKHLQMIDESMGQEVERVMNEMGKALAQISGQFTQDYTELTAAMKSITSA
jgi:hypothetical protein